MVFAGRRFTRSVIATDIVVPGSYGARIQPNLWSYGSDTIRYIRRLFLIRDPRGQGRL